MENTEDITSPCVDMNFIFEWSTRYLTSERGERVRYRVEQEKIKFISISEYVIFCLLHKHQWNTNQLAFKGAIYYITITTVISSRVKITRYQVSYDHRSYERNLSNCVEKPEKVRISMGFEPVTSRYRCDALTNWAMRSLSLGAGHLWVIMSPWSIGHEFKPRWSPDFFRLLYVIP